HGAALLAVRRIPGVSCLAYADALYRAIPGLVDERLAALRVSGVAPSEITPSIDPAAADVKRRAVEGYASQLRALSGPPCSGHDDAFNPERYWRLDIEASGSRSRASAPEQDGGQLERVHAWERRARGAGDVAAGPVDRPNPRPLSERISVVVLT